MRIKKKDVILEAMLIDITLEFTPQEKRLLRVLHKKFGVGGVYSNFDRWESAAFLIEDFDLPYDIAHDLSLTYWWNGDKLFKDIDTVYKKENRGYIFQKAVDKIKDEYIKIRGEDAGIISINWEDKKHIINHSGDTFTLNQQVNLWDGFKGFTLYIPFYDVDDRTLTSHDIRNDLTLMIYIKFEEYNEEDEKSNTHINIDVEWTLKDLYNEKYPFMSFDVPIPTPLTKDAINNIFNLVLKDVFEKIENTTFRTG